MTESDPITRLNAALEGRYRIERELGEGGMATVYLADDLKHGRRVAIKVLKPDIADSLGAERFVREIEIAAGFSHPNILALHDSGEADGLLYFVMPYVEGESLRERLDRDRRLPLDEALEITRQVADALDHAHARGLVHRDIKPENILFQAGHAVVTDFGIARALSAAGGERLTRTGVAIGTIKYMSPEQATGDAEVDARTDVYSLGCVLYEMLAGEAPHAARNAQAVLARKLVQPAPIRDVRPDVPVSVADRFTQALATEPEDRFATPGELAAALLDANTAESRAAGERRLRANRRRRVAAAGAVLVALGGGAWFVSTLLLGPAYQLLAVLPPTDLTNDPDQEHLVLGVHDGLIRELQMAGVRVISRSSVMQFAGVSLPARDVGETLGIDAVLEITFNRVVDSVALDLRLVDGTTEELVWFALFGGGVGDLPTLYREATRAITEFIGVDVSDQTATRLAAAAPVSPQAYDAYRRGVARLENFTPEQAELALQDFERALAADSDFALAYLGIGQVWGTRRVLGLVSPAEAEEPARAALRRAFQLDSTLSDVHAQMAGAHVWTDHDFAAGETSYVRALQINPSDVRALTFYSHLLTAMGRAEEATPHIELARELDPGNVFTQAMHGVQLMFAGKYEAALVELDDALRRSPSLSAFTGWSRMGTLEALGRSEEAVDAARAFFVARGDPGGVSNALDRGYTEGGHDAALQAAADRMAERSAEQFVRPMPVAYIYALAGRTDEAFEWLDRAYEVNDHDLVYLGVAPLPAEFREDPRFEAILRRIGLPVERLLGA